VNSLFRPALRRAAWHLALSAARLVAVLGLTAAVLANLGRLRRARAILLYPGGGFGHTISGPDWLRRLHPEGPNITLFATFPRGHNRLIADLWGKDALVWVQTGMGLPGGMAVTDVAWTLRLFRALHRIIRTLAPRKTCYFGHEALSAATRPALGAIQGSLFDGRYEGRYYTLMQERPAPALHLEPAFRGMVERRLRERFGSGFQRRCAFYIRYPAETVDPTSASRRSPQIAAFVPSFRVLNAAGYQVLITGDAELSPELIAEFDGGLVDWRSSGLDKEIFLLYAGLEVDVHIGNLSGGSAFLYVTDMPGLMLNAWSIGDALPRTTVHYKRVSDRNGRPIAPARLFTDFFFDFECKGCVVEEATPEDMAAAVRDFIEHCETQRPYGVDPAEIGIAAPWFQSANARLSPVWLARFDLGARRRDAVAAGGVQP
jgi:hypothetical protein